MNEIARNLLMIFWLAFYFLFQASIALAQQSVSPPPNTIQPNLKVDAPVVLCIDDKPAAGGKPSANAYAKAAANGFRSILTLRSDKDRVDTLRERLLVESYKMRYFNLPAKNSLPRSEQIDEFLRLVKDKTNQPMLINCAFAARVAPYLMIFRIVEQGWAEEKALEDATQVGLRRDDLQKFARNYLSAREAR
jgi:protein tyrosine phosphatase (PTP) superfamily phosphohydrolase (DUF442 family)